MEANEAIGDIVHGALLARSVEPHAGEAADGHSHESACLNCGTVLVGAHCHGCGQAAHVHKTIGAFFHDLLHGVFHFEGKIWRTLPLLAWHPGRLTREYIDGRRASYVSPIALFLFSIFFLFAAARGLGGAIADGSTVEVNGKVATGLQENEAELARLRSERARLVARGGSTEQIDGAIAGREQGSAMLRKFADGGEDAASDVSNELQVSGLPALADAIGKVKSNPALVLYKLQTAAYKYSWALIPLSVPFVWLLLIGRRRFGLYDHTVFVTYSISFMSLAVAAAMALRQLSVPVIGPLLILYAPVHMFRQLRGTYALGNFGAAWRTVALQFIAFGALLTFAIGLAAMELTG